MKKVEASNETSSGIIISQKEKNEEYYKAYAQMLNKFVREFVNEYCNENNDIEWEKIVRLNAAIKPTKEGLSE